MGTPERRVCEMHFRCSPSSIGTGENEANLATEKATWQNRCAVAGAATGAASFIPFVGLVAAPIGLTLAVGAGVCAYKSKQAHAASAENSTKSNHKDAKEREAQEAKEEYDQILKVL